MENGIQFDREMHGGLFDRGQADSYYRRPASTHWYPEGTGFGRKITDLSLEEVKEYMAGYNSNEIFKDWEV